MLENTDWTRNSAVVLQSLQDIKTDISSIKEDISTLKVEVGQLKVKSGFYGIVGGVLAMIPVLIMYFLK